jgi:hypothetical protein
VDELCVRFPDDRLAIDQQKRPGKTITATLEAEIFDHNMIQHAQLAARLGCHITQAIVDHSVLRTVNSLTHGGSLNVGAGARVLSLYIALPSVTNELQK